MTLIDGELVDVQVDGDWLPARVVQQDQHDPGRYHLTLMETQHVGLLLRDLDGIRSRREEPCDG